jgi:hypothetical protein
MKTTRCTTCSAEFTDEEIATAEACPSCGTTGTPMSIAEDTTININWHELRILTIWASNWAQEKCDPGSQRALETILRRLDAQRPKGWAGLTVFQEIKELPQQLKDLGINCGNVEMYMGDEKVYSSEEEKKRFPPDVSLN